MVTSVNGTATVAHSSTIAVPQNEWSMVTVRMTGGNIYLSKNNETEESFSQSTLNTGSGETFIGSFQGSSEHFRGNISGALIIDSITTDIRTDLYNLGIPKQPEDYASSITDNYVCALPLNDGVVDPENDRSANNNDGTLVGSPTYSTPTLEYVE